MGRPPSAWMHDLAKFTPKETSKFWSYQDISKTFGVGEKSLRSFINKLDLEKEYEARGRYGIRVFDFAKLKEAIKSYIEQQLG